MHNVMEDIKALRAELERLKKENSEMKKRTGLILKVTDRNRLGVVFGTYTCSLFKNQWLKILEHQDDLKAFIKENDESLD